jgi:hypothetical protein
MEMTSKYLLLGAYALLGTSLLTASGHRWSADAPPSVPVEVNDSPTHRQSDVDPTEDNTSEDDQHEEEDYKPGEDDELA